MTELNKILSERGDRYGSFADVANTTMRILRAIQWAKNGKSMSDSQEVALQMIASKIARIANGDPDYIDNWVDIAGYAQLIANKLEAERLHKGGLE